MVNLDCHVPGCNYNTGDFNQAIALAYFNAHIATAHGAPAPEPVQPRRTPRVERPPLTDNITEETWNAFDQSWAVQGFP